MSQVCTAVWDATPSCKGWNPNGLPIHGCKLIEGRHHVHVCECGETVRRNGVLPPPQVGNVGQYTGRPA